MPFMDWGLGSTAQSAYNTAADAAKPRVTFSNNVPSYPTMSTASGSNLSYSPDVKSATNPAWDFSNFMDTFSFGELVSTVGIDDQRAARTAGIKAGPVGSPIAPIPTVNTVNKDGSAGALSGFGGLVSGIFDAIGSSGDGGPQYQTVAYKPGTEPGAASSINPMWIAAGAVAAGVLYYAVSK